MVRVEADGSGRIDLVGCAGDEVTVWGCPRKHYTIEEKDGVIVVRATRQQIGFCVEVPPTVRTLIVQGEHTDVVGKAPLSTGTIKVETDSGSVHLALGALREGVVEIRCNNGSVELEFDPTAACDVAAEVEDNGTITVGGPFAVLSEGPGHYHGRLNGGGAEVRLVTENGEIRVHVGEGRLNERAGSE